MADSVRLLESKYLMMQKYHGEILRNIDAAEILCPGGLQPDCKSTEDCVFKVGYPSLTKCNLFYIRTVVGDAP